MCDLDYFLGKVVSGLSLMNDNKLKIKFSDGSTLMVITDKFLIEDGYPKLEVVGTENNK